MIDRMLGWMLGQVRFTVQGGRAEWLLNQCADAGIPLSGVRAVPGGFAANVPVRCYPQLHPLARHAHSRVRVQKRRGLWFRLCRLRGRWGLLIGPLLMLAVIGFSGHLVWAVRFSGLDGRQQVQLRQTLYELGVQEGSWIDPDEVEGLRSRLLAARPDYAWVTLNFYRGRLVVEGSESNSSEIAASDGPTDLVAAADGTVKKVDVRQGNLACAPGQTVAQGQLLAAGTYLDRDSRPITTRSSGHVWAEVEKTYACTQDFLIEANLPSGQAKTSRTLCFGRWSIPVGRQLEPSGGDRLQTVRRPLEVLGFALPATLEETTLIPRESSRILLTEQQAQALARQACLEQLAAELPGAEILSEDSRVEKNARQLTLTLRLRVHADIAREVPCE